MTDENPEMTRVIPVERAMPLKIAAIELHDSPEGTVYVYNLERDRVQEELLVKKWHEDNGLEFPCEGECEHIAQWIAQTPPSFATRQPLNVGVGEYYTVDLVPWTPLPIPEGYGKAETLMDFLRRLAGG